MCSTYFKQANQGENMTNEQIIELYQRKLNMTLAELSAITGKSIKELKKILLEG
jgi:predicted HTH domain antitoxin